MITMKIQGLKNVNNAMNVMEKAHARSLTIMRVIGNKMRAFQLEYFKKQEDPTGKKWADLAASTIQQRRGKVERALAGRVRKRVGEMGLGLTGAQSREVASRLATDKSQYPILQDTGTHLRNTISVSVDSESAHVGTASKIGPTHQYGDPKRNIPARPFLGWDKDGKQMNVCTRMLTDELLIDALKRA